MQVLVMKVGWLLQHTIGTTACESMNAAANIFLGMTEAPLLIRPYLPLMTKSEIHAVMTGGFATIAGSVLAAYINFGISASHLLSASVMAAPAALAFSKLVYPETEESKTQASSIKIEKGTESNALEAATNGASTAIKLVSNIAANLIAFVAFVALLDTVLSWMGSLIHWDFLSFEWILSKLFIPASLLMGVDWDDKEKVANLVGLKMVVNEFVAYKRLADYQKDNQLSARSEAIATYALCGFSNVSSIGIQIGALSALAPGRKSDFAQIALRAMITGTATCFLNACVAGTLLQQ
ncbi:Solute carrier family 28 member 3, partial [Stegodyphus mimosarum]